MGQLPQLLSRLFPFKRGLNHAYWAPNAWALVTALDRFILKCKPGSKNFTPSFLSRWLITTWEVVEKGGLKIPVNAEGIASTSRGLVGDTVFAILPNVKPIHTFLITIAFQSVSYKSSWRSSFLTSPSQIFLVKLWKSPTYKSFLCALTLCGYVSYMFGWHVHEKAILLVLVPLRSVFPWFSLIPAISYLSLWLSL